MSNETENKEAEATDDAAPPKTPMDPVRKWTLIVLGACVVLMFWYLVADRVTPYTTQARVHALVVPIASQVSGIVVDVFATNNQYVETGQELFRIDPDTYQLAVETAQANMQSARQATGASGASVDVALASVESARAALVRANQDAVRLRRIKEEDPGAISDRRLEQAEASVSVAMAQFASTEANLEKARQDLGVIGDQNSRILQAQAGVDQAELDLSRTTIRAASDGLLTDVRVDRGNFASAGAPQMTFIGVHNIWVQADFTENNLGNIKPGDPVELVFDALPGRIISGRITSTGFGVDVAAAPLGSLPTIDNNRQWLRDAQRFPVQVEFQLSDNQDRLAVRVGAQASVIAYTGNNWLFNTVGKIYIRIVSILTYAF
ncbi:MAG: HlyD family secretion protein [Gammaproteobacteria bacterium]|nr:MAG: HlyD family secretion protein [Gammaproteobacteria bacterium]RLA36097.1 MAG: HlyD family secretion protein [Gammaproteobacteria bacterium]